MEALPVNRNEDGHWTHPDYAKLFGHREFITQQEFKSFCESNNIESSITELDGDTESSVNRTYFDDGNPDINNWSPSKPEGYGWFIGSIHDTEDGPICVWFRKKQVA
ncbi:hypothetical protein [Pantoea vagans]|uniref:hypothetical protein n=1 Tax=Pantoea vagans TaxID=470934 RepID=UPI00320B2617